MSCSTCSIVGHNCGSLLVQCSANCLMDGHWTLCICSSLSNKTPDGKRQVAISTMRIPKLKTSIAGE